MNEISLIFDVFFNPKKAFEILKEKNYFISVLVLALIISGFSSYVFVRHMDYKEIKVKFMERMEKRGRTMSEEEVDKIFSRQEEFAKKTAHFFAMIGSLITFLFISFLFFILFKLIGAEFKYKSSFSFTLHGFLPSSLSGLLSTLILLNKGKINPKEAKDVLISHLGFLVDKKANPRLYSFLSSIDFFSIWSLILLIYGFSILSGKKIKDSAYIIGGLWVLYLIIKILLSGLGR